MNNKHIVALGALVALVGGGYYLMRGAKRAPTTTPDAVAPANQGAGHESTADANYDTPGGPVHVTFSVRTDATGNVLSVKSSIPLGDPISGKRVSAWNDAIGSVVVGKKFADLKHIDVVGGSSLTTAAFNDALARLK